jgi:hypothetical protein
MSWVVGGEGTFADHVTVPGGNQWQGTPSSPRPEARPDGSCLGPAGWRRHPQSPTVAGGFSGFGILAMSWAVGGEGPFADHVTVPGGNQWRGTPSSPRPEARPDGSCLGPAGWRRHPQSPTVAGGFSGFWILARSWAVGGEGPFADHVTVPGGNQWRGTPSSPRPEARPDGSCLGPAGWRRHPQSPTVAGGFSGFWLCPGPLGAKAPSQIT